MSPDNQNKLRARVVRAAESALESQGYVSAVDILTGIGWLDLSTLKRWRQGQVSCLEAGIQTNPSRVSAAMDLFRAWATERQLYPSETTYVARAPSRPTLRFSLSGDATIERLYRTHWVSRDLPEKQRERITARASRAPELVVIQPLNTDWKCHRCGGTGGLLMMEEPGPACLSCAGLSSLEFLPAGDAALSRRAKAESKVYAVVVRFSRSRKRYERQGLLVQPEALKKAAGDEQESAMSRPRKRRSTASGTDPGS
ncbi:MAG TPA: hypothetical protein VFH68_19300 [Polyangia bacterium]|jgi:hypothetical protein|nr:hypothetical protein [Polyangia bacterium]